MEEDSRSALERNLTVRFSQLTKKKDFKAAKKIIADHNPSDSITKNKNGYFINLKAVSLETLHRLDQFLNVVEGNQTEESPSYTAYSEGDSSVSEHIAIPKKHKYTNTEAYTISRKKYEEALKRNADDDYQEPEEFDLAAFIGNGK